MRPAGGALDAAGPRLGDRAVASRRCSVGLAARGVSLRIFLRTYRIDDVGAQERRGEGVTPPLGRVHFLAMIGLTVNLLALAIIVMTGIGAPLLPVCQQS